MTLPPKTLNTESPDLTEAKRELDITRPAHYLGYTRAQVEKIMGKALPAFDRWMRGQTVSVDELTGQAIYYAYDVERYFDGRRYIFD